MPKCKICKSDFKVHKHAIEQVYAIYCKPCIIKAIKKTAELSTEEYMELQAKIIGL